MKWKGNIKRLGVVLRYIDIPDALFEGIKQGGYENDEAIKAQMFDWVEHIWRQKDQTVIFNKRRNFGGYIH